MTAVNRPLSMEQGATFHMGFNWYREALPATDPPTAGVAYNLTGCKARMQIRKAHGQPVLVNATSVGVNPMIVLGGINGRVDITIPATGGTDMLNVKTALYDFEMVMADPLSGGVEDVHRLFEGSVKITLNITQTP